MKRFDHESGAHLETGGAKIYYEETGERDAPVLLFLHGGFGNIEDFNVILPKIAKDFRIVGIDSRGQGKSTVGANKLTYEAIQKDVENVLKHLNIDTLSIVGLSDGGIAAYRLAAFSDLKIEKLVTTGSRWHIDNARETEKLLTGNSLEDWKRKMPDSVAAYEKLNPEPDFPALVEKLTRMWLDESASGYANEEIGKFGGKLLITKGDEDHLLSLEAIGKLSKIVRNSHLFVVPFAKHVAFQDQPEIFVQGLNEFLRK